MRKIKKRNPSKELAELAKEILKNADDFEFLSEGHHGELFYFISYSKIYIKNIRLLPNEYILKIFKQTLSEKQLEYFAKLSNLKLIPEVFILNPVFLIMQYIEGITLFEYFRNKTKFKTNLTKFEIYEKIKNLINKYHSFNLAHDDLNVSNILISKDNVFFIDPGIILIGKNIENQKLRDLDDLKSYKELLNMVTK